MTSPGHHQHGWALAAIAGIFLLAPFLTQHPYLPFLLIALVGLATIIEPSIGLAAVVLSVPVQEALVLPFVRNELTYSQVTVWGLVLGWAVTFYRYRIPIDSIVLGFLAVFAAFAVSLVEMDSLGLWVGEVYRWVAALAVYVVARSTLTKWVQIRNVLVAMTLGVIGLGLHQVFALVDQLTDPEALPFGTYRAIGTFIFPNPLAAYLEFTIPVLLLLALKGLQQRFRIRIGNSLWVLTLIASGGGFALLGLTQSRGGWVGMGFALLVIFFVLPSRTQVIAMVATVLVIAGVMLSPVGDTVLGRLGSSFDQGGAPIRLEHGGTWGRASLWQAGINMIADKPLTGVGAGEYDYHYREHVPVWVDRLPAGQAHNGWLQLGAQAGIPGMISFTLWLGASLWAVAGAARTSEDDLARALAWGALAVLVAFSIHSLVDYLNVLSLGLQISVVTAIGLALAPGALRQPGAWRPFSRRESVEVTPR